MNKYLLIRNINNVIISIILTTLLCVQTMYGQIVHREITDPFAWTIEIDFDNDGVPEFDITEFGSLISYNDYGEDNAVRVMGDAFDRVNCPVNNQVINAGLSVWLTGGPAYLDGNDFAGNGSILDGSYNYIAVRFNLAGSSDVYYGWIRFYSESLVDLNLTYIDYAYNSVPNEPIVVGEGVASVNTEKLIQVDIYPNPTTSVLNIKGVDNSFNYAIINVLGEEVMSGDLASNSLNLEGLNNGVYFLNIINNTDGIVSSRRFIKR